MDAFPVASGAISALPLARDTTPCPAAACQSSDGTASPARSPSTWGTTRPASRLALRRETKVREGSPQHRSWATPHVPYRARRPAIVAQLCGEMSVVLEKSRVQIWRPVQAAELCWWGGQCTPQSVARSEPLPPHACTTHCALRATVPAAAAQTPPAPAAVPPEAPCSSGGHSRARGRACRALSQLIFARLVRTPREVPAALRRAQIA